MKHEEIKRNFHAKGLLEAKEKLDELKLSDPEKKEYKKFIDNLRYQESMVDSSYNSGKIDGRAEGRLEGEKIGIEKGKLEIIQKMQAAGMTAEEIAKLTGKTK